MHGELKDYRQPMVTSLGILLGFLLNFLAGWASGDEPAIQDSADAVILATIAAAVALMVTTLFRILKADLGEKDPAQHYRSILGFYIAGVSIAFVGFGMALLL